MVVRKKKKNLKKEKKGSRHMSRALVVKFGKKDIRDASDASRVVE